jgi:hypothetical protein
MNARSTAANTVANGTARCTSASLMKITPLRSQSIRPRFALHAKRRLYDGPFGDIVWPWTTNQKNALGIAAMCTGSPRQREGLSGFAKLKRRFPTATYSFAKASG